MIKRIGGREEVMLVKMLQAVFFTSKFAFTQWELVYMKVVLVNNYTVHFTNVARRVQLQILGESN